MSTFEVTVEATIRKTYCIHGAKDEDEAREMANQRFSVLHEDGVPEKYDQQIIDVVRKP